MSFADDMWFDSKIDHARAAQRLPETVARRRHHDRPCPAGRLVRGQPRRSICLQCACIGCATRRVRGSCRGRMPRAYRQLYRWHDGENDDRWGHLYGLPLLPLERAAESVAQWKQNLAAFDGNRYPFPGGAWPENAVDPAYANPRWIPLTEDGSGNHIGLDFDPWPGGRIGQVIIFGRDEDVKVVLAESLGKFLEWIAGSSGKRQLQVGRGGGRRGPAAVPIEAAAGRPFPRRREDPAARA